MEPSALVFDVLGTMVDEHGSIRDEITALLARHGSEADPGYVERLWRARFGAALDAIRTGAAPYAATDEVNRRVAAQVVREAALPVDAEELDHLGHIGHRLRAWPDSVAGVERLAGSYPVVALSNGNRAMLADLHAATGLRWHQVVSGEEVGAYKPDPTVYRRVAQSLGRAPADLMMVAAHPWDLRGAAAVGMQTAYVARPDAEEPADDDAFDLVVGGLDELCSALAAPPGA